MTAAHAPHRPPLDARPFAGTDERPAGPMAPHVGGRFAPADFDQEDGVFGSEELVRVAAWPVSALIGRRIVVVERQGLAAAVLEVVRAALPGFPWEIARDLRGAWDKYGIVHVSMAAPPEASGGRPMALEFFAQADDWAPGAPVSLPATVTVRAATYANVAFPGVGVPFYL